MIQFKGASISETFYESIDNIDQLTRFGNLDFPYLQDALCNFENYGIYGDLVRNGYINIHTSIFNLQNIDENFYNILNILRDGIEQDVVQNMYIIVTFVDNVTVKLSIFDYWLNTIMWYLPVASGDPITSRFLFWNDCITQRTIKDYIDSNFLDLHRTEMDNIILNNIIDDTLFKFKYIDEFSLFLMNTINEEDTIELMKKFPEVYDSIHADLSNIPIENIKDEGMRLTNIVVDRIKQADSEHCLRDSFRAEQAINPRQFKEFLIHIGTVPDGHGGVYPYSINTNFSMEGANNAASFMLDSSKGRQAQILAKNNVGDSGAFSRDLGLNNMDTYIKQEPKYICNTKNFVMVEIKNKKILDKFKNRYYRLNPNGFEYKLSFNPCKDNIDLLGKVIYLRSPMTCASASRGEGVCYRCYGDLAYTNNDISIGKIAAELISSKLTQKLLSAKHLLETNIPANEWSEMFDRLFEAKYNIIRLQENIELKKWKLSISDSNKETVDDIDEADYNEYVTTFDIIAPNGKVYPIHTKSHNEIYLSTDLCEILSHKKLIDDNYIIDFAEIADIDLFLVSIPNDGLSKTLELIKSTLNKKDITNEPGMTKDKLLQKFLEYIIEGGLNVDSVHCEVIISNQIRRPDNKNPEAVLLRPEWEYPDEPYMLVTLNRALRDNPNVALSLMYQKIGKALYYPLSFKKTEPSSMDLFYMEKPQEFMSDEYLDKDPNIEYDKLVSPVEYVDENKPKNIVYKHNPNHK